MNDENICSEIKNASSNFSLLYPPGVSADEPNMVLELDAVAGHDLSVEQLIKAFSADREHQKEIRKLFSRLPCDPDIISYRQDVLEDFLSIPELVEKCASLFPVIDSLFKYAYRSTEEMKSLHEVMWRVGELQNIIDCFEGLGEIFQVVDGNIKSQGLRRLQEEIRKTQEDQSYQGLARELPSLLSKLRACASITVGVNLDASLCPIQATLLSVNERPFTDQSCLP